MIDFTPSASLAGRGEKQCKTRKLLNRVGGCVGGTCFSRVEDLSNLVDDYAKGWHMQIECGMCIAC
jgi:hypothetical protein